MGDWSLTPPGEVHDVDQESESYQDFRPGLDFAEVRLALDLEAQQVFRQEGRRMFVTRSTVLGRMHQLKQEAWRARKRRRIQLATEHMPEPDIEARKAPSWDLDYPDIDPEDEGLPF